MQRAVKNVGAGTVQRVRNIARLAGIFMISAGVSFAASQRPVVFSSDVAADVAAESFRTPDQQIFASVETSCKPESEEHLTQRLSDDAVLQEALASEIRNTYRIERAEANTIVQTALRVSNQLDVDPFIVLGIASVESSMNKKARSNYGAAGLMQVYAPMHGKLLKELGVNAEDKEGAAKALMRDLEVNVTVGTRIYQQYLKQYKTVAKALQAYNGAKNDATQKYSRKVLRKRDAYEQAVRMQEQLQSAEAVMTADVLGLGNVMRASGSAESLATLAAFAPRNKQDVS